MLGDPLQLVCHVDHIYQTTRGLHRDGKLANFNLFCSVLIQSFADTPNSFVFLGGKLLEKNLRDSLPEIDGQSQA